ncbi:serpin family protein [Geotalea toluenoxydans]|uniref:serpin family protein n=1 Tax=Geotalea toluenoxydans TaxID=421624 RepID=UPI0006D11300|nr:serpin family protein [Geotalea toluenoxydans]
MTVAKAIMLMMICLASACTSSKEPQPITKPQHTSISLDLGQNLDLSNNTIYCASFQMAWNSMRDEIIKGDIILENDGLLAKRLNRQSLDKNDLSRGSYVAVAGELTKELVSQTKNQLNEKFGDNATRDFNIPKFGDTGRQLVAYAFLYKNLEFPFEFEKLDQPITYAASGQEAQVKGFGVSSFSSSKRQHQKLSNQVAIFDYKNENNFIISLRTKLDDDQVILAKITPKSNLLQTYTEVMDRIRQIEASLLRDEETIRVPIINFEMIRNFSELENKRIMNKGWEGWYLAKAIQDVKFKLDEKGAVLKSSGFLSAMKEEVPPSMEKPRKFIFDKPFLILLKQKTGNYPYFAMWVSDPELFIRQQ